MRCSVLMSVYNGSIPQLREAVDSILQQQFGPFELILCDDGSEEPVRSWLETLQEDSRVRLLRNRKNRGLAASLNRCIGETRSPVLIRQDGDDRSRPGRLRVLTEFMETHPDYAVVSSNVALFDDKGIWGKRIFPPVPKKRDFLISLPFQHGACAFRKETLLRLGGYQVSKLTRRCEDLELLLRLYEAGEKGCTLPGFWYEYREDKSARSRRKYRYRLDEARVKWQGFRRLDLWPEGMFWAMKPLAVGLLPTGLAEGLKDRYYGRRDKNL